MGLAGITLIFTGDNILGALNYPQDTVAKLAIQLMGALYLGFAMLNRMAQGALIGGIFAKPISMANAVHFFVGAMALIKVALSGGTPLIWVACAIYTLYAVCFLYVAFTAPKEQK